MDWITLKVGYIWINKCIEHEIPFLESGTQGEMAHTSFIMPFITNTYTDYPLPKRTEEKKEYIPFCTLRNRPSSVNHCIEWAISKFNDHFNCALKDARMFLQSELSSAELSFGQVVSLIKLLEWISNTENEITFKSCLRYALTEFHKYFYTDIQKLEKSAKEPSIAPIPLKFDMATDEVNDEKSHFAYVYAYACCLYSAAVEEEIKDVNEDAKQVKHDRNLAKKLIQEILEEPEIKKLLQEDTSNEDGEEEIMPTVKDEEYDLAKYANLVDHLTELRASVKHQLTLDKDNEMMLGFVHSAACIRADNFRIPHDHVTLEMTHLACGKIVPALSTTTGIIIGYLMNEMLKLKLGVNDPNKLYEHNINMASPSISMNYLMPAVNKQQNSMLRREKEFLAPSIPSINLESNYIND